MGMQNRIRAALIAALSVLTAAPATAQQWPPTFPANTVFGRLGITAGPGQAIPFNIFAARIAPAVITVLGAVNGIMKADGAGHISAATAGTDYQVPSANLTALLALSSTGFPVRTGSNTWAQRTIAGTTSQITVTNGDGISGNPVLSFPTAMSGSGITWTGGTFSGVTLSGTTTGPGGTTISSAGNVNVGAGTGAPTVTVNGASSGSGGGPALFFGFGGSTTAGVGGYSAIAGGTFNKDLLIYQSSGANNIVFRSGAADRLLIDPSGNFGFNTTTPTTFVSGTLSQSVNIAGGIAAGAAGTGSLILADTTAASDRKVVQLRTISGLVELRSLNDALSSVPFSFLTASLATGKLTFPNTLAFTGIPTATTPGCLSNDASGNISGGAPCSGTGFPSGGVAGDLPFYTAASTGTVTKSPEANILPLGGDPTGSSTSTAAAVLAYGYSKRIVLPPAAGGTTATYKFVTAVTFPSGTELIIPCGVTIKPNSTIVVRNNGVTKGGQCQIADTSAGGIVYLGRDVRADWWPSTGSDDALAINAADASTTDAASQSADGTETIIRLSCKAYTAKTAIILNASSTNPQKLVGCGSESTTITGTSAGTFSTNAILTQNGKTAGGGTDLMNFTWRDFSVTSQSADQNITCVRLGTSGNAIRSYTKNVISRVKISECRTGLGWYNTRLMRLDDVWISVHGETTGTATAILMDHVDDSQFNGDSDFYGGQYVCTGSDTSGGGGYGLRMKSERVGSNHSGIRFHGSVFYNCNKMVYGTWALTGTMGDHWFSGGVQCELCGNIADYSGAAAASFTGAISTTTLTMSAKASGVLVAGQTILGSGITTGTTISGIGTCGGTSPTLPCTATVNNSQTVGSEAMTSAKTKSGVLLRFDDIYVTGSGTAQSKFRFSGYGAADEVVDILVHNVRIRSGGGCATCRFVNIENGANLNITGNQIISFEGTGSNPNELINLYNTRKTTVVSNTVDADGISGGVPYLVTSASGGIGSNDIVVTGNNARLAVSAPWNNANSAANRCISNNLPSVAADCP